MSIYAINLTDFNDKSLLEAINEVPPKSLILFENIDCMKTGKARADGERAASGERALDDRTDTQNQVGVTLSGLLNVMDGFSAPENMLFVMTTNKPYLKLHTLLFGYYAPVCFLWAGRSSKLRMRRCR
jgi:mitochondrial chaperone BCS1